MSVPWLGADWHLAGDFRDVTRCLPARVHVGFGKRTAWKYTHTHATQRNQHQALFQIVPYVWNKKVDVI